MAAIISRYLDVKGLNNTRDLGGMRTKDGRTIRPGMLLRCGGLDRLQDKDWLCANVALDVDFRSSREKEEHPDPEAEDVEYLHIPIFEMRAAGVTRDRESERAMTPQDPESAIARMSSVYRSFIANEFSLSQYRRFIHLLLEPRDKAVLWHCSAGKDRTGIAALFVQELLGVGREDILADYLVTNEYLSGDIERMTAEHAARVGGIDETQKAAMRCFLGACEEYPLTVYRTAEELYGSFEAFLREGLGISDAERETLRGMYLEA